MIMLCIVITGLNILSCVKRSKLSIFSLEKQGHVIDHALKCEKTITWIPTSRRVEKFNLLLTEREGRTGEYWPKVVAVRTERSEVRTKTTEGQYSPVRLEQARLVSSLLYGTRVILVSKLPAFENKKYTSYDHFHGNGLYGKIPTKKEPIRTPGFTPTLPCHIIKVFIH